MLYYEKDFPTTFNFKQLKTGNTVLVRYAERDIFRVQGESVEGVRVDALDYVRVIERPLSVVRKCMGLENTCSYCNKKGELLRCTKCKVTRYCNQACQRNHWKEGHKDTCPSLCEAKKEVDSAFKDVPDWASFDRFRPFPILQKLPVKSDFFGKGAY